MNNQIIIRLVVLMVLLAGGLTLYNMVDRGHMNEDDVEDSYGKMIGHHDTSENKSYEVYPGAVAELIRERKDIILLDVRTPEEYEAVHITGATLLPVQQLSQQTLNQIGLGEAMKDKEIILYCRSGARSQTAYNIMKSLGYTNVKSIAGGMIHWQEDQYPFIETGAYTGELVTTGTDMVASGAEGPQILVDRPNHDFGVVPQYGGTVEAEFSVTNTGTETLEIGDITTSCSCTSATIANPSVEPGESTTLTVIFDPDFHEEPLDVFKRTVFMPTNDPDNPEAEVSITVDIAEGQ